MGVEGIFFILRGGQLREAERRWRAVGGGRGAQFTEAALNQPITVKENISWCVFLPPLPRVCVCVSKNERQGGRVHVTATHINTSLSPEAVTDLGPSPLFLQLSPVCPCPCVCVSVGCVK